MIDFDHVAIATTDASAALGALVGDLGGAVFSGGDGCGFRWVQVRVGEAVEGMTVEILIEWKPEQNDFLARFLARHGPGQHHLTFKVSDLASTLERVRTAGNRSGGRRSRRAPSTAPGSGASSCRPPSLPAAVEFFAGLLDGEVIAGGAESVELAWPGSGQVRLELNPHAPPGFLRLEADDPSSTAPQTIELSGAALVLTPD